MNHVDSCRKTPHCRPNLRTREAIAKMELIALHHPPYGPDLAHPNFHFLGHLKDALRGRRFADEDKGNTACTKCSDTAVENYTRSADSVSRKSGKIVLVMKETLWANNLNIFKGCDHDICKFHYNRTYEALPSYRPHIYIYIYIHKHTHTHTHIYIYI